jgi:hypothetical protein
MPELYRTLRAHCCALHPAVFDMVVAMSAHRVSPRAVHLPRSVCLLAVCPAGVLSAAVALTGDLPAVAGESLPAAHLRCQALSRQLALNWVASLGPTGAPAILQRQRLGTDRPLAAGLVHSCRIGLLVSGDERAWGDLGLRPRVAGRTQPAHPTSAPGV